MILYHGSNMVIKHPKIITNEKGRDFGFAFYVTPIKEQAERMAKRKQKICKTGKPIVSVFEWDEDKTKLNYKCFDSPDLEWLEMISDILPPLIEVGASCSMTLMSQA